jgi:histidyl-tRNA synthetase
MTITGETGSYTGILPSAWDLAEEIRKRSFTQLLDYRDDLKNPRLSYADNRNKRDLLILVDEEINKRMKR